MSPLETELPACDIALHELAAAPLVSAVILSSLRLTNGSFPPPKLQNKPTFARTAASLDAELLVSYDPRTQQDLCKRRFKSFGPVCLGVGNARYQS